MSSVKHEYDLPFNKEKPQFLTCNANTKTFVDGTRPHQEVKENEEIIFTYDVTFQVYKVLDLEKISMFCESQVTLFWCSQALLNGLLVGIHIY
jgi:hypothetical protein